MKKRLMSMLLALLLVIGMAMPVLANPIPSIIDESDVLTDEKTAEFEQYADRLEEIYGVQVVYICTELMNGLDNPTYVDQISSIYSEDCMILLDNQDAGTIYIQGFGAAINVLDDEACDNLLSAYNDDATFAGGVQAYLETAEAVLADNGLEAATPVEEVPVEEESEELGVIVEDDIPPMISDDRQLPRLNDEADILTAEEEAELLAVLDEISERQTFDVVIAVVNDFEQSDVKNAAYDYYDYNGFGFGPENDGVWLYLSMAERDLNIGGTGFGITAFTDFGREQILEQIKPELGEDAYYAAFMEFAEIADDYVTEAKNGTPYDVDHEAFKEETNPFVLFWGFLFIGLIVAFILTKVEEGKLKSVQHAQDAQTYLRQGSLMVTNHLDYFVYTDTVSIYSPKEENKGGSTIDSGSSGVDHSSTSSKF